MAEFTYDAIGKDGSKLTASIQAPNLAAAGHLLKEQGLLPTQIQEQGVKSNFDLFSFFSRISLDQKINFIQNLSVMLKAGIAISRCLQILSKQAGSKKFSAILEDIYNSVQQGKGLSEAMEKYPNVFPSIVISMIKVGELSGNLDKSLEYLSIQLQREADLKSKVRGAMIYPAVIVGAMIIIGILMSIFVLPSLFSTFTQQNLTLPLTTQIVMGFSNFMSQHTFLAIGGIILIISGCVWTYRTALGRRYFDLAIVRIMVIGVIVKKVNLARFARILSSLLKSGVPIVQGLDVAGESLDNIPFRELIAQASLDVKVGKPLAESLGKNDKLFPLLVVQMISVGEESGSVQEILEQLAIHYEAEVDDTLKNLSSVIEPLLILVIGAIVGVLALALITPIYSVYQTAGG
jgi:type IV pilus assembly protein PilC